MATTRGRPIPEGTIGLQKAAKPRPKLPAWPNAIVPGGGCVARRQDTPAVPHQVATSSRKCDLAHGVCRALLWGLYCNWGADDQYPDCIPRCPLQGAPITGICVLHVTSCDWRQPITCLKSRGSLQSAAVLGSRHDVHPEREPNCPAII